MEAASSQTGMPPEKQYHTFHKQIATCVFIIRVHTDAKLHKVNLLKVAYMVQVVVLQRI
jgi:hypothetical protein